MPTYSNDALNKAAAASSDAASAKRELSELEHDLARMRLVCAALWELLKEKQNLSEKDLFAKVAEIDARDGIIDGKLLHGVRKCKACGRNLPGKQNKCMYCQSINLPESVFESL